VNQQSWTSIFNVVRDPLLFIGGLLGTGYETIVQKVDRPSLLALYAGMMGLPAVLGADRKKAQKDTQDSNDAHGVGDQTANGMDTQT
jgi:hypothetical protein